MSDHLPTDVVTNILLRLPVAAILRCRAVCKPWRALIDTPRFTKLQLDYTAATTKNAVLFVLEDDGDDNGDLRSASYVNGLRRDARINIQTAQVGDAISRQGVTLFGSCDGLFCLGYDSGKVLIINPATRKSHSTMVRVTISPYDFSAGGAHWSYRDGCGFGYDSVSDDYKVVKINQKLESSKKILQSEVISHGVRLNSRVSVNFPYFLAGSQKIGVFVGGAIHWVAGRSDDPENSNVIVGFDLGLSVCKEIPQPKYTNRRSFSMRVGELGKCLCIFANYWGRVVDVWMMKDYGVKESWSILFSVPHPGLSHDYGIRSLGFSMTGHDVLVQLDDRRLVWYDLKNSQRGAGAAQKVTVNGLRTECMDAVVCFGSLVPPDGKLPPKEVKVEKQYQKPRPQRKKRDDFLATGFKLKL
ncbi:unnamed protein product [Linum trigynum]|uniref:F-box domain-containing protein n=1 Tax=Linum trigynum TaxID=586398 RepID=A0AAV2EJ27_9ROSI